MARADQATAVKHLAALLRLGTVGGMTDAELLGRFATRRDEAAELAFGALVMRHGPMVHRVCRGVLRDSHEADDAFQATFLVLVRRAGSLWVRDSLGPWLHQTAYRTARRARSAEARRRRHETHAAELTARSADDGGRDDFEGVVHEEVGRLPQRYRAAVVLCLLEGRTPEQAARSLGCPVGTVHSRLARGRARLRSRLTGRGLAIPAVLPTATATVPPALAEAAVRAAMAGLASTFIDTLTRKLLRTTLMNKFSATAAVVLSFGLITAGTGLFSNIGATTGASPQEPPKEGEAGSGKAVRAPTDRLNPAAVPKPVSSTSNAVHNIAYAPDGKTIATSSLDDTVSIWDAATAQRRTTIGTHGLVVSLAFSSGGETLAGVRNDGQMSLWNPKTGEGKGELDTLSEGMREIAPPSSGSAVVFSPDGRRFATGGDSTLLSRTTTAYQIRVFETDPVRLIWEHIGRGDLARSLAFSPDGKTLAHAGPVRSTLRLWDVETGDLKQVLKPERGGVYAVSFSSDGKLLAAGGGRFTEGEPGKAGGQITIWDAATGERLRTLDGPPGGTLALAFAPVGHEIACGGTGRSGVPTTPTGYRPYGEVRLWDADSGELRWRWKGSTSPMGSVMSLAFSPDGKTLAVCDAGEFSLIDAATGETARILMKTMRKPR